MTRPPAADRKALKGCPFCGGKATYKVACHSDDCDCPDEGGEFISCDSCNASTALWFPLKDDVNEILMDAWNRRVKEKG